MNITIQNLKERRSIRKFKPDPIPQDLIDQIIEAGLYAPTGKNQQDSIIIAVTQKKLRDQIAQRNCEIGGWDPSFDPFYGAPVILIVLANRSCNNYIYDGSLTMGNLLNAAHALGLGSCWIHRTRQEFETQEFKDLLTSLGIKGDYEGIGHCALGYIDGENPLPPKRKDGRVYYIR